MTKLFITAAMVLATLTSQAQVSEKRNTQNFSKIEVASGIELVYTENEAVSISVEAENDTELKNIITAADGKTLRLFYNNDQKSGTVKFLKVYVNANKISSFKASASAKIVFQNLVKSEDLTIDLSSGGTFNGRLAPNLSTTIKASSGSLFCGNVQTQNLRGEFKSGAKISVAGNAKKVMISTATKSHCNAKNLASEKATINSREFSSVLINGQGIINANPETGASITYFGKPKERNLGENSVAVKIKKEKNPIHIAMD